MKCGVTYTRKTPTPKWVEPFQGSVKVDYLLPHIPHHFIWGYYNLALWASNKYIFNMKKKKNRITQDDYIRAVKKANREIELENSTGFKAVTRIHKSKKAYNRKEGKKIDFDPSFISTN